jgi:hypothetical protein
MNRKSMPWQVSLTKGSLTLIAILLAFLLILIYIWLWYDIRIASLDKKEEQAPLNKTVNQ